MQTTQRAFAFDAHPPFHRHSSRVCKRNSANLERRTGPLPWLLLRNRGIAGGNPLIYSCDRVHTDPSSPCMHPWYGSSGSSSQVPGQVPSRIDGPGRLGRPASVETRLAVACERAGRKQGEGGTDSWYFGLGKLSRVVGTAKASLDCHLSPISRLVFLLIPGACMVPHVRKKRAASNSVRLLLFCRFPHASTVADPWKAPPLAFLGSFSLYTLSLTFSLGLFPPSSIAPLVSHPAGAFFSLAFSICPCISMCPSALLPPFRGLAPYRGWYVFAPPHHPAEHQPRSLPCKPGLIHFQGRRHPRPNTYVCESGIVTKNLPVSYGLGL